MIINYSNNHVLFCRIINLYADRIMTTMMVMIEVVVVTTTTLNYRTCVGV